MKKRARRNFTREFKEQTVALVGSGQRTVGQVCEEFGLADSLVSSCLAAREGLRSSAESGSK